MQYPYRIKIMFSDTTKKLEVIQYINRFMVHSCKDKYEKWNISSRYDDSTRGFKGIEIAFSSNKDAVHFRLGYQSDSEKIICENFS